MPDRALGAGEERSASDVPRGPGADPRWVSPAAYAWIAVQVALVLAVPIVYRMELDRGFVYLAAAILCGFLVHAWLPVRWRTPFFVALAIATLGALMRADAAWVVLLSGVLLGICHVPVPWGFRAALLAAAAGGLAAAHAGVVPAPWEGGVVTAVAGMFMFRAVLYMYDLKTDRTPATLWQRIAYFFLLPNVFYPFFPIVDYKTFLRTTYDKPAIEIYQKGAFWMLRGATHLLAYRIVYHLLPLAETELSGIAGVTVFMAMTFGLYLRVSGLYHLITGALCLFGFNLPPTNHHYFLASGFTDVWRRTNIYWKDFMMTAVFYPVLMALRTWSMTARLVAATALAFVVTWILHAYQWFWLRGTLPLVFTDAVFYGVLGLLVVVSTVWESRHGRQRRLSRPAWSWRKALTNTLKVLGTFLVMCTLWSMWNDRSILAWWYRLLQIRETDARTAALFAAALAAGVAAGVAAQWLQARGRGLDHWEKVVWRRAALFVPAVAAALLLVSLPAVHQRVGGPVRTLVRMAQSTRLNRIDRERQERGYYETLSRETSLSSLTERRPDEQPEDWVGFRDSPAARPTNDLRGWEIIPGVVTDFKGVPFVANRWGMRDRDYARAKPPGTYRIALVGGSYDMGSGVADDQTYENLVEDRLNRELADRGHDRYEVLNFAVGGYSMIQVLPVVERRVPDFQPDVLIVTVHPGDYARLVDKLYSLLEMGVRPGPEHAELARVLERARASADLPREEFTRRMEPYQEELLAWTFGRIAVSARAHGTVLVFLFLPLTNDDFRREELADLRRQVDEAGGVRIEVPDVFEGYSPREIQVTQWDTHPNVLGHRIMAEAIYPVLLSHGEELGLVEPSPTGER